eukprot:GEMP01017741.1.p1 GENE.GEMP01017741.1~~GEMP01017741.1.p1  ORF type:complete len:488 (+),score=140.31 GEMP01017741.1:93-1556(+)
MSRTSSRQGNQEIRDVSKTLSAERREKLIALRDREAMKDVLLKKFQRRYGTQREKKDDDALSVSESVIRNEVDTFVQKANLTEENLARLERRIRQHSRKTKEDDLTSVISAYSRFSDGNLSIALKSNLDSIAEEGHYDWSKLDEYAKFLHEQDAVRQKAGIVDQQKKLRSDLDKQVQDGIQRKQKQEESDAAFWQLKMDELDKWKEEEKQKELNSKVHAVKERESRDLQLLYEKQLREAEDEKKRKEEEQLVRKIAHEVVSEKERAIKQKEAQRAYMLKVFEESAVEKMQKKAEKQREMEQDGEYVRKYNEMMEKQDKAKKAELEGRMDRQKRRVEKMEESVMNVVKKKDGEAAERADFQRKDMEQRLMELELNKAAKLCKLKLDTQKFLLQQMQEHDANKQQQRDMKEKQGQILEADSQEFDGIRKQEVETRRLRNLQHRLELQQQIEDRKDERSEAMSAEEIAMNKKLLKKVDTVLLAREQVAAT